MSANCRPRVQLLADAGNEWPHSALQYHQLMPISCYFRDCKALLVASLTDVKKALEQCTGPLPLPHTTEKLTSVLC